MSRRKIGKIYSIYELNFTSQRYILLAIAVYMPQSLCKLYLLRLWIKGNQTNLRLATCFDDIMVWICHVPQPGFLALPLRYLVVLTLGLMPNYLPTMGCMQCDIKNMGLAAALSLSWWYVLHELACHALQNVSDNCDHVFATWAGVLADWS